MEGLGNMLIIYDFKLGDEIEIWENVFHGEVNEKMKYVGYYVEAYQ